MPIPAPADNGNIDKCPYDPDNDADSDKICGDVDACPFDGNNDEDSDGICADVDSCPLDLENDPDGDAMVTAAELERAFANIVKRHDRNRDGALSMDDWHRRHRRHWDDDRHHDRDDDD